MVDIVKHLSGNRIIGDLIAREKYSFVDGNSFFAIRYRYRFILAEGNLVFSKFQKLKIKKI